MIDVKKKIVSICLIVFAVTQMGFVSNANSPDNNLDVSIEEKKERISETGAPDTYVDSLPEIEIVRLYELFDGKNIRFAGSKEESFNPEGCAHSGIVPYSTIPEDQLKLRIYYFEDVEDYPLPDSQICGLILGVTFEWKRVPTNRMEDALTLNWDGSIFVMSSFHSGCGYYDSAGTYRVIEESNVAAKGEIGGVGWYAKSSSPPTGFIMPTQGYAEVYLVPDRKSVV